MTSVAASVLPAARANAPTRPVLVRTALTLAVHRFRGAWPLIWLALTGGLGPIPAGAASDFTVALGLYQARHYSAARAAFQDLAAAGPANPEIDFYLGRLALWFDDSSVALRHLERAARQAPREARMQNALGDAYGLAAQEAGLLAKFSWAKKCRTAYERAVELDPDNPVYHWSLFGYFLVAPAIAGGGFDRALARAAGIRRLDPMSGRIALATLYLAEKSTGAAFAQFDEVLRQQPDDFLALYHIGRCAALSGEQLERGLAALRRCLALAPPEGDDPPTRACIHHRIGNILEWKCDRAGAQQEYTAAGSEHPDFRPAKIALKY